MTINKGVEFLIDRMRQHPSEFTIYEDSKGAVGITGRWEKIYDKFKHTLSAADLEALRNVMSEINADTFLGELMSELADGPERREKEAKERAERARKAAAQRVQAHKQAQQQQAGLGQMYNPYRDQVVQQNKFNDAKLQAELEYFEKRAKERILAREAELKPQFGLTEHQKNFLANLHKDVL
jgi:hypothetical protein